jgi:hypothetical protein
VRPLGPGGLLRIVSFTSRQFSSHGTKRSTFGIGSLQKILLVRAAMFFLGAAIAIPSLAQSQPAAAFRFFKEVHWGSAVLQPGDYFVSISAGATPVVTVVQKGGASAATIAPRAVSSETFSGNTRVVMSDDGAGAGAYVTSLYLKNTQTVLTFAAPGAQPQLTNPSAQDLSRQKATSSDSAPGEGGLFAIDNRRSQAVPYAEAQALYLSACKVVEQEFARTDPIRPRLTLVLGASTDGVDYPKHEIQLTKWDKYQFAQGVVILAVSEILPQDMRISLTRLAVLEAESTVGINELKK